jgi:hypothetical protein
MTTGEDGWRRRLELIAAHSSAVCTLHEGATPAEISQLEHHLGSEVFELEPTLGEFLRFSNGMEIGGYRIYKASDRGIDTIEFRTVFVWELNPQWEHRMYLFMGVAELLLDVAVVSAVLGQPCIGAIIDSGYKQNEVVPLASSLDVFLGSFLAGCQEALARDARWNGKLSQLSTWPPDCSWWYARDLELAKRLAAAGLERLRPETGRYAEYIFQSATAVLDDRSRDDP